MDADSPSFAHAFEDLPAEARQQAAEIASTQPGISLGRRIREELETFGLDSYGTLEQSRLLRFLAPPPHLHLTLGIFHRSGRDQIPGDESRLEELLSAAQLLGVLIYGGNRRVRGGEAM